MCLVLTFRGHLGSYTSTQFRRCLQAELRQLKCMHFSHFSKHDLEFELLKIISQAQNSNSCYRRTHLISTFKCRIKIYANWVAVAIGITAMMQTSVLGDDLDVFLKCTFLATLHYDNVALACFSSITVPSICDFGH